MKTFVVFFHLAFNIGRTLPQSYIPISFLNHQIWILKSNAPHYKSLKTSTSASASVSVTRSLYLIRLAPQQSRQEVHGLVLASSFCSIIMTYARRTPYTAYASRKWISGHLDVVARRRLGYITLVDIKPTNCKRIRITLTPWITMYLTCKISEIRNNSHHISQDVYAFHPFDALSQKTEKSPNLFWSRCKVIHDSIIVIVSGPFMHFISSFAPPTTGWVGVTHFSGKMKMEHTYDEVTVWTHISNTRV